MSGPIVRRYGFPNFDSIFGKRELEHGIDKADDSTKTEPGHPSEKPSESNHKPQDVPKPDRT